MKPWFDEVPEEDREEARQTYVEARTFEEKVRALKQWHPRAHVNLTPIETLEEYFKYVRVTATDFSWFRGESQDFARFVPRLYRNSQGDDVRVLQEKERKYYLEFRRRARSLVPEIEPSDTWSWYFLIQHYGGQTRLLDWTQDAAIALFFALETGQDSTGNPIVTTLQPGVLVRYALSEIGDMKATEGSPLYPGGWPTDRWITNITGLKEDIPDSPVALLPPYCDQRITAQRSCFTLFGKNPDGFLKDGKHIVCPACSERILSRMVIDRRAVAKLRKELARIGITSGKVYPGLDGLCREITCEVFRA